MKEKFSVVFEANPDEQFSYQHPNESLRQNEYLELKDRDRVKCQSCNRDAKIVEVGDEKKVVCPQHTNDYNYEDKYWKFNTKTAVEDYLSENEIEFDSIQKASESYLVKINNSVFLFATGEFNKSKEKDFVDQLKNSRNPCVVCFSKGAKESFTELTMGTTGLSMAIRPPNLPRKISRFNSLSEMREDFEEEVMPENNIPDGMMEEVTENPMNVVERLTHFEKVEKDKSKWNDLEPLSVIALAQIYDLPLKTLGASKTGTRVPDGVGILKNKEGEHTDLILLDAKSVSSKNRNYPKITGDDAFQYKKYLEKAEEVCWDEKMDNKFLIFISPEFKEDKALEFLEELEDTTYSDFRVAFLTIEGLSVLLMTLSSFLGDRKIRSTRHGRVNLSRKLLLDPYHSKQEIDYELGEYDSLLLDGDRVYEHVTQFLDDAPDRDEVMERIRAGIEAE